MVVTVDVEEGEVVVAVVVAGEDVVDEVTTKGKGGINSRSYSFSELSLPILFPSVIPGRFVRNLHSRFTNADSL